MVGGIDRYRIDTAYLLVDIQIKCLALCPGLVSGCTVSDGGSVIWK